MTRVADSCIVVLVTNHTYSSITTLCGLVAVPVYEISLEEEIALAEEVMSS